MRAENRAHMFEQRGVFELAHPRHTRAKNVYTRRAMREFSVQVYILVRIHKDVAATMQSLPLTDWLTTTATAPIRCVWACWWWTHIRDARLSIGADVVKIDVVSVLNIYVYIFVYCRFVSFFLGALKCWTWTLLQFRSSRCTQLILPNIAALWLNMVRAVRDHSPALRCILLSTIKNIILEADSRQ